LNYQEFMKELQLYYGGYEQGSRIPTYVMAYLKHDIDEEKLNTLFRYITYYHPVRYKAPGISDIEKAIYEAIRNNKGSDVHKIEITKIELEELTEKEKQMNEEFLRNGGLMGLVRGKLK